MFFFIFQVSRIIFNDISFIITINNFISPISDEYYFPHSGLLLGVCQGMSLQKENVFENERQSLFSHIRKEKYRIPYTV